MRLILVARRAGDPEILVSAKKPSGWEPVAATRDPGLAAGLARELLSDKRVSLVLVKGPSGFVEELLRRYPGAFLVYTGR